MAAYDDNAVPNASNGPPPESTRSDDSIIDPATRDLPKSSPSTTPSGEDPTLPNALKQFISPSLTLLGWRSFVILFLFRLGNSFLLSNSFAPDEHWQSSEVAHWLTFGYGGLTWEWEECIALRNWLHPLVIAGFYQIIRALRIDIPYLVAYGPRLFFGTLTAFGIDLGVYFLTSLWFGHSVGILGLAFSAINWFHLYALPRTYSTCLETLLNVWGVYFWSKSKLQRPYSNMTVCRDYTEQYFSPLPRRKLIRHPRVLTAALLLGSLGIALRPTALVHWGVIFFGGALADLTACPATGSAFARNTLNIGVHCITYMALLISVPLLNIFVDRLFYGRWTVPAVNFAEFNLMADAGEFYGRRAWHFFYLECPTVVFLSYLPLIVLGVSQSVCRINSFCFDEIPRQLLAEETTYLSKQAKLDKITEKNAGAENLSTDAGFSTALESSSRVDRELKKNVPENSREPFASSEEYAGLETGQQIESSVPQRKKKMYQHAVIVKAAQHRNKFKNEVLSGSVDVAVVIASVVINIYLLNFASHKEYRFLLPYSPLLLPLAAAAFVHTVMLGKSKFAALPLSKPSKNSTASTSSFNSENSPTAVPQCTSMETGRGDGLRQRRCVDKPKTSIKSKSDAGRMGLDEEQDKGNSVTIARTSFTSSWIVILSAVFGLHAIVSAVVLGNFKVGNEATANILRGVIKEIRLEREAVLAESRNENSGPVEKEVYLYFLTSCHEIPLYSFLHDPSVHAGYLDCSPQLRTLRLPARETVTKKSEILRIKQWHDERLHTGGTPSLKKRFWSDPINVLNGLFDGENFGSSRSSNETALRDVYYHPQGDLRRRKLPKRKLSANALRLPRAALLICTTILQSQLSSEAFCYPVSTELSALVNSPKEFFTDWQRVGIRPSLKSMAECLDPFFETPLRATRLPDIFVVPSGLISLGNHTGEARGFDSTISKWLFEKGYSVRRVIFDSLINEHHGDGSLEWNTSIWIFTRTKFF